MLSYLLQWSITLVVVAVTVPLCAWGIMSCCIYFSDRVRLRYMRTIYRAVSGFTRVYYYTDEKVGINCTHISNSHGSHNIIGPVCMFVCQ